MNLEDLQIDPEELRQLFTGEIPYGREIGFYLDESTSHRVKSLWTEGIAVTTVEQQGQKGEPSDMRILAHARSLGYVLVTKDKHFGKIHELVLSSENTTHAGIILLKSKQAKDDPLIVINYIIGLSEGAN